MKFPLPGGSGDFFVFVALVVVFVCKFRLFIIGVEFYMHVTEKSIQKIKSPFDDL